MTSSTSVIQVTNVSPSSTAEQMRTLFGFIGTIDELRLFPPDDSPLPVTSRVCFVKFHEPESVGVSQHLTNTVFVDRALIVVPFAEGVIPDESKALSLLAPANAVAGLLPGGGLLPTPNPVPSIGGVSLGGLGGPNLDPMAALALAAPNINTQALSAEQLMKLMASIDPKLNHLAAGLNLSPGLKADSSNKEIEEAMKRVREAQSLISAAIEPGKIGGRMTRTENVPKLHPRATAAPDARAAPAANDTGEVAARPDHRRSPDLPRGNCPAPRLLAGNTHTHSYTITPSSSDLLQPENPLSLRHKKEKKKDKDRERDRDRDRKDDWERNRDKRERSDSKKSKDKDKDRDRDRDRKSDSEKGDVKVPLSNQSTTTLYIPVRLLSSASVPQVTRDYDEEEQGYDSEHERNSDTASSPQAKELRADSADDAGRGESDGHSEDQRDEDMDMSD
uniref:Serine and arginine rich splicing factor 11 n=1 Tax=Cyprinus carpio TaxID=7962 RepID=A0A8C1XTS4_CYPCA